MRGRRIRRLSVTVLLATLVLTACGGGDDDTDNAAASTTEKPSADASSSTTVDGCTIVTAADAKAVFGETMTRSDEGTEPQQMLASCAWTGSTSGLVTKMLQFDVFDGSAFYAPDQYKEMPGFEEIDGVGDSAFAYGVGAFHLTILVGDRTVGLSASGFDPADSAGARQAVLDLVPKVLDRL